MRTTIDKAGRVVIPAGIRERAGVVAGAELEVSLDQFGIRLERVAPGPRLVKVGRRTVARPTAPTETRTLPDIAALAEEERNPRPEPFSTRASCLRGSWISGRKAGRLSQSCTPSRKRSSSPLRPP